MEWLAAAVEALNEGTACVLVTVAAVRGSAPRESGAKMAVMAECQSGTIGGGQLEYSAAQRAREVLDGATGLVCERYPLGPAMAQCCGGDVQLVYQRLSAADLGWLSSWSARLSDRAPFAALTPLDAAAPETQLIDDVDDLTGRLKGGGAAIEPGQCLIARVEGSGRAMVELVADRRRRLWLFGAGHVGQALVRALAPLPFHVTWVDQRLDYLPAGATAEVLPLPVPEPARIVPRIPAGCFVLVMSHSHPLDLEICAAALRRDDLPYVGLIGSATKKARFLKRFAEAGLSPAEIARLTCPIGLDGVAGKHPAVIAASVAADLLRRDEAARKAEAETSLARIA